MIAGEHRMDLENLQQAMKVLSDVRGFQSVLIIDMFGATLNTDVSLHNNREIAEAIDNAFEQYYEDGEI